VIYVTIERVVRRRPEVVWDFLTDTSSLTAWVEGVVEARVLGEATSGVGLEVEIVRGAGARAKRAVAEVTAWREASLLAVETRLPEMLVLDRATLAPHPEGTALGVYAEILYSSSVDELLTRPGGLLRASPHDAELEGIYARSVDALVKRIESLSAMPYR
jgi:hypothetical protein